MKEYERFKNLYDQIDILIAKRVTSDDPEFETWRTKTERFLIQRFGENSREFNDFLTTDFSPNFYSYETTIQNYISVCHDGLVHTKAVFSAYLEEFEEETSATQSSGGEELGTKTDSTRIFVVHGHDEGLKYAVARLIEKQGLVPIILHEQPNLGATIIEKFEKNSEVGAAICLLTADDIGRAEDASFDQARARQNVVFEAGFFMGCLGRKRVILLAERGVELPSDLKGVVYTDTSSWQLDVLRELRAMGFEVDYNKID